MERARKVKKISVTRERCEGRGGERGREGERMSEKRGREEGREREEGGK